MENIATGIFLVLIAAVLVGLLIAWPVMVLWGAVADDFGIQTIGLGTAWQISALAALLFKPSVSSS